MHDQHVFYYVWIMVKSGMSLPWGKLGLITEVLSLFSPYSLLIPSGISLLVLLCAAIYSFITALIFTQCLQKIRLVNHICSLAELLHADTIQQLELAPLPPFPSSHYPFRWGAHFSLLFPMVSKCIHLKHPPLLIYNRSTTAPSW